MENSFMIQRDCRNINWITAADIFLKAPLGTREPDALKKTFENSQLVCFVLSKQELIGMGRAISNGINSAAIYDIVVLPQYQGKGVGTRIMEDLLKRLEGQSIVLYSVPGKEPFYMKFGFKVLKTGMGILSERLQNAGKGYIKQAEDFVAYQNWYKNDFCISTNPLKLQIDVVHQFLATSYWAKKFR